MHRVFVYGTLKRGNGNHSLLAESKFVEASATLKPFWMITTTFPIVLDDVRDDFAGAHGPIAGEIYHVDDGTLAQLDRLERVGRSYDRKVTEVTENGKIVQGYIYIGCPDYWHRQRLPSWSQMNKAGALDWDQRLALNACGAGAALAAAR